jgi:ferredoxin
MFKILHYRDKCLGCAYCVEVAPALFEVNENDGKVDLIQANEKNGVQSKDVNDIFLQEAEEAVSVCPAKIIVVRK